MNNQQPYDALETATRRRTEALDLLHKTLNEYVSEMATNNRSTHNGMHRAMLLQNFADAASMLAAYLAEERRLIRERLEGDFGTETTGKQDKEAAR